MHKKVLSIGKKASVWFAIIITLFFVVGYLLRVWLSIPPPEIANVSAIRMEVKQINNKQQYEFGKCRLRLNDSGLWEMYLEGTGFERGVAAGKMSEDLLKYQEDVFIDQIKKIIPSNTYLMFLRNFIGFFNRNLADNIPEEFKEEIYGISLSCSHEYDFIGTPYERQLNYHAAHDLGHAMQDYMLVGCTSFACWEENTEDSTLLIGRNFDFYVGDDFAKNKIVAFYRPEKGYPFASVTWAGMTGVLSGMNKEGLTVTINAAKSSMPTSSATPISILCREILQYASTIDEALAIAKKRNTFVSESILIGSAKDKTAAVIEKSPDKIALYRSSGNSLVCANHYQSETFRDDPGNQENIKTSDSPYRQQRTEELIKQNIPLNPDKIAAILRNKEGLEDKNIGLGNEKVVNQLIAHHSVIFAPEKGIMWVSTSPWQLGKYIAYDLNKIFADPNFSSEIKTENRSIPADSFLVSTTYKGFIQYRNSRKILEKAIRDKTILSPEWINKFVATNPEFYYTYEITGDYYFTQKNKQQAVYYWEKALEKEIPKQTEKEKIRKKLTKE